MPDRSETLSRLAEDICDDNVKHRWADAQTIIGDRPLADNEEILMALAGDSDAKADFFDKVRSRATGFIRAYLDDDGRGMALVEERMENERDEQRSAA